MKRTMQDFANDGNKVHNNFYIYPLDQVYKNNYTPVKIICPKHNEFFQTYSSHIKIKCGCPQCGTERRAQKNRLSWETVLFNARKVHGNLYEYFQDTFINSNTKMDIHCNHHNMVFQQSYDCHVNKGFGCPYCSGYKISWEEFKKIANKKFNNFFTYFLDQPFSSNNSIINIKCPKHDVFSISGHLHLLSQHGCAKCANENNGRISSKGWEKFVEESSIKHNHKYIYPEQKYIDRNTPVKIFCPIHQEYFWQRPGDHIRSAKPCGCPKCAGMKKTWNCFVAEAKAKHDNKFIYPDQEYVNRRTKVEIDCPEHGLFFVTPAMHVKTHSGGCKKCQKHGIKESLFLDLHQIPEHYRHYLIKENNRIYNVDGFDPETNTIYEFDGDYWHGNPMFYNHDDMSISKKTFGELYTNTINRQNELIQMGYKLIQMWEYELDALIAMGIK